MPCFKGLAVSIHTPDGPLPEYSIQKQSRVGRISSYIPVPPPKIPTNASSQNARPEQSTFAVSITLLTPGLSVPYSSPKPTTENPYPQPRKVGGLSSINEKGGNAGSIPPYLSLTTSPNETIAAYIYFDGRLKEEVATLLRRGEETWVNSRWVSVPDSEGGGLAEREFLFREVGLERWLNGLDLEGKDAAAKIEKRRVKLEKKRRRRKIKTEDSDDENEHGVLFGSRDRQGKGVLRYGEDTQSPLEHVSDSDEMFFSDSDDTDDDPIPESTGQIKIALYRVLASGDIRRGEYSPQFGAHEGDDDVDRMEGDTSGDREDIDHTTGFAKPKTLDPKSISTQTVTGIDPQEKPFAVFTFWYRGEKQLQKMNILPSKEKAAAKTPISNGKRGSIQDDFSKFKPLDSENLKKFSQMRDPGEVNGQRSPKKGKKRGQNPDDSDDEVDNDASVVHEASNENEKDADAMLSPEDAKRQGELAEGVQKIRLKRQHSAEEISPSPAPAIRQTPPSTTTPSRASPTLTATPAPKLNTTSGPSTLFQQDSTGPLLPSVAFNSGVPAPSTTTAADAVGSPLKKARSSLSGMGVDVGDEEMRRRFGLFSTPGKADGDVVGLGPSSQPSGTSAGLGLSGIGPRADVLGNIEHDRFAHAGDGGEGTSQSRNLGGLLGGILGKGSQGASDADARPAVPAEAPNMDPKADKVSKPQEIKMEEEEEL